jgi:hypothetical protein
MKSKLTKWILGLPAVALLVPVVLLAHLFAQTQPPPNKQGLPPGMTLTKAGELVGTPTEAGTWEFSVCVTDAATGQKVCKAYTFTVRTPPVQITSTSIPDSIQGNPFTYQFAAVGGLPPYAWEVN